MLDDTPVDDTTPASDATGGDQPPAPKKRSRKKAAAAPVDAPAEGATGDPATAPDEPAAAKPAKKKAERKPAKKAAAKKSTGKRSGDTEVAPEPAEATPAAEPTPAVPGTMLLFQAPEPTAAPPRRRRRAEQPAAEQPAEETVAAGPEDADAVTDDGDDPDGAAGRRRRRRGGRRRRKGAEDGAESADTGEESPEASSADATEDEAAEGSTRRRRRRRRAGEDDAETGDDPENTVTRVRQARSPEDQITAVSGSTRLEAKKQRRREGREIGRRRAPIVSEAEFLARRESVERVMVIRQRADLTQIAVLEDKVLVEHYVARESQTSLIGNVYLGRVQNVLPSMEAAFIDIGKGRNAVLYAGEVNWSALGHPEGQPRKIESVLSSGQSVLVQVTKDPVGHKGARLTSQISLAGRFLVYVPDGTTSGISRKLPDTERHRLKTLLKEIVPDTAGVIVRTAAEGASEDELTRDVERLKARWEDIEKKAAGKGSGPQLLYGEPDLTLKVVRDLFTEDFTRLVIDGDDAWDTVQPYVTHVAPDLEPRLLRYDTPESGVDAFAVYRIDEQIAKGLDRKVWLPSGGSLIIDRTEAMTVVDVNTGKFTGSGGNLEETVTKNNLEAAEEIVRQLRLRDIGGIIVIDFIDMVLESNRDLVLRRLVECLGRDRTRHQVAEVTSLGLVQMTRKRIGTGLLEAFSETCDHCAGRGLIVREMPVEPKRNEDESRRSSRRRRGRGDSAASAGAAKPAVPSPKDLAAAARPDAPSADEATDPGATEALESDQGVPGIAATAGAVEWEAAEQVESDRAAEAAAESAEPGESTADQEPEAQEPPVVEPAEEEGQAAAPATDPVVGVEALTEPPRVVTRTRRRAASRPAGPPVHLDEPGSDPNGGAEVTVDEIGAEEDPVGGEHELVGHVPIKRKGSRKR